MRKTRLIILSIIAIFSIGLIAGNIFGHLEINTMTDSYGFSRLGRQLATFGNFDGSIRRGPIYPVFLGLIYRIFGENLSIVIFFQAILLSILGICTFMISYKIFQSTKIAFLTGIFTVLHPFCIIYVPKLWLELLFADLILLMVWSAYKAISHPTLWNLIKFGVFAGIASLCKAIVLFFPLFLAGSVLSLYLFRIKLFSYLNWKILFKLIVIPTSVMFIVIFPWTIRNHIVSNTWTLVSSNVGVEFFRGNVYAEQNSFLLQKTNNEIWDIEQQQEMQILSQKGIEVNQTNQIESIEESHTNQIEKIFDSMMIEFIVYHPLEFIIKILKQIPAFWVIGMTTIKSIGYMFLALLTLIFFIKGFLTLRKTSVFAYIVIIIVIYFNLIYAATLAWARYSMPIYPPMLIICLYGIPFGVVKDKGIDMYIRMIKVKQKVFSCFSSGPSKNRALCLCRR